MSTELITFNLVKEDKKILKFLFYNEFITYKDVRKILKYPSLEVAKERIKQIEKKDLIKLYPNLDDMRIYTYILTSNGEEIIHTIISEESFYDL